VSYIVGVVADGSVTWSFVSHITPRTGGTVSYHVIIPPEPKLTSCTE
jgi:hypothetical protein